MWRRRPWCVAATEAAAAIVAGGAGACAELPDVSPRRRILLSCWMGGPGSWTAERGLRDMAARNRHRPILLRKYWAVRPAAPTCKRNNLPMHAGHLFLSKWQGSGGSSQ